MQTIYINIFDKNQGRGEVSPFTDDNATEHKSRSEALAGAIRYDLDHGLPYLCTLTTGDPVDFTDEIEQERVERDRANGINDRSDYYHDCEREARA